MGRSISQSLKLSPHLFSLISIKTILYFYAKFVLSRYGLSANSNALYRFLSPLETQRHTRHCLWGRCLYAFVGVHLSHLRIRYPSLKFSSISPIAEHNFRTLRLLTPDSLLPNPFWTTIGPPSIHRASIHSFLTKICDNFSWTIL